MFEAYFGFERTPFTKEIPSHLLYSSAAHQELVSRLLYVVEHRALGLVTGEVGTGKTIALRALCDTLDPARYRVAYIAQSALKPRDFYRHLCQVFGLLPPHSTAEARRSVQDTLLQLFQDQHKTPVVIIDEAHLLAREMLEEVRFLTNFHMDSLSPLALILAGQSELLRILHLQAFAAIAQRIAVRFHLPGLSKDETERYIRHHLKVAGCSRDLFTAEALAVIFESTQGIPRKINNLCHACLLHAFIRRQSLLDDHLVKRIIATEFTTV